MMGLMPGLMMNRPLLVQSLLDFAALRHADTEVVTRSVEGPIHRIDYLGLSRRTQQLAHALVDLGIKPGDRVATLAWNTWRHVELYYAVAGIGAVCHTINPRLSTEQLAFILNDADDRLLFFDIDQLNAVAAVKPLAPKLERVIAMTDRANAPRHERLSAIEIYDDLLAPQSSHYDWPEFDENTAASLCYTSGTTGNPKGVLYSHRALVLHAYACCLTSTMGLATEDRMLPVVPMFHVNAWGVPYAAPIAGTSLVMPGRKLDGDSLFELMDAEGVTCSQGVPTVWMSLLDTMRRQGRKPKALSRIVIGGAAASEMLISAYEDEFGIDVSHAWGMTEMTPLGVVNTLKPKFKALPRDRQLTQKLKQGRAVYGVDLRIVDGHGAPLPNDGKSPGHLQVRGPWIVKSYFKAERTALTPDGWFDTGDIATIDPDGYMHITDRAKDVIKSGGEWISSVDLENAAMGHPEIAHAAVIGMPDAKWQERPMLVCVGRNGARPDLAAINAFLATKVPKWWLPDRVEFVDVLPVGPTGKIQKTKLRERFLTPKS